MLERLIRKLLLIPLRIYLALGKRFTEKDYERYETEKSTLRNLYKRSLYWHGTGRYHYLGQKEEIVDIFEGIIQKQGLLPLVKDPWLKVEGDYKYSISLANIRMYGSVYALIHLCENCEKVTIYGSRMIWSIFIALSNFLHAPLDIISHAVSFLINNRRRDLTDFQIKVRSRENLPQFPTFLGQLMYMPSIRSDIDGNYPILIAIKESAVQKVKLDSGFDYYETRTSKPVGLEDISHLEVPHRYIDHTKQLLQRYNADIPIISFESAELYVANEMELENCFRPVGQVVNR